MVAAEGRSAAPSRGRLVAASALAALVVAAGVVYATQRGGGSSAGSGVEPVLAGVVTLRPTITGVVAGPGGIWASSESGGAATGASGLLWRIDPASNDADPPVTVAAGGPGIAAAAGAIWTVSPNGTTRVDPKTGEVVATIATARGSEIEGGGSSIWVGQTRVDPATNTVATTGSFDGFVTAIGPEGTWARSDVVERVDPRTGRIVATLRRPGFTPNAVAVGGGSVWVAYASRNEWETTAVARIDPATNRFAGKPLVLRGRVPSALAFAAGSLWLLAHNEEERGARLTQIDPDAEQVVGEPLRVTGGTPALLAAAGRTLWIAEDLDRGTVTRVDLR
jgi:hypothetical protein